MSTSRRRNRVRPRVRRGDENGAGHQVRVGDVRKRAHAQRGPQTGFEKQRTRRSGVESRTGLGHCPELQWFDRIVDIDHDRNQRAPRAAVDCADSAAGGRGVQHTGTLLVLEQDFAAAHMLPDFNLQGRFQNVAVARVEADGTVTQSCIDKPKQAASFFGIDPALLGVEAKEGTTAQQSARRSPARKSRQ